MLIALVIFCVFNIAVEYLCRPLQEQNVLGFRTVVFEFQRQFPGLAGLPFFLRNALWFTQWPSFTEVATLMLVAPLVMVPTAMTKVLNSAFSWLVGWAYDALHHTPLFQWLGINEYLRPYEGVYTSWVNVAMGLPPAPDKLADFPTHHPDSPANAEVTAYCAQASYEEWPSLYDRVSRWRFEGKDVKLAWAGSFERIDPPVFVSTEACLFSVSSTAGGTAALVLAFRGTETLSSVDWLTDFVGCVPDTKSINPEDWPFGFFHSGFMHALGLTQSLKPQAAPKYKVDTFRWSANGLQTSLVQSRTRGAPFQAIVEAIQQQLAELRGAQLFVTGHSLGAALANLFTAALVVQPEAELSEEASREARRALLRGATYTWAQPRVGGPLYVRLLDEAMNNNPRHPRLIRLVNTNDVVPRVPPAINSAFQHSNSLVYIKPNYMRPGLRSQPSRQGSALPVDGQPAPSTLVPLAPFLIVIEQMPIFYIKAIVDAWQKLICTLTPSPALRPQVRWVYLLQIVTHAAALVAGLPIISLVWLLWLILLAPVSMVVTLGLYASVFWLDALLLAAFTLVFSPVAAAGLVEHSMLDYYHAVLHSDDYDWGGVTNS